MTLSSLDPHKKYTRNSGSDQRTIWVTMQGMPGDRSWRHVHGFINKKYVIKKDGMNFAKINRFQKIFQSHLGSHIAKKGG